MANTCPYNLELECDEKYRVDEFYRQIQAMPLNNIGKFCHQKNASIMCIADVLQCQKYQNFIKHR